MLHSLKFKLWFQYLCQKTAYATVFAHQKKYNKAPQELWNTAVKHLFHDKMLYLFKSNGLEMDPAVSAQETLVVRKLLHVKLRDLHEQINVGDVIVMKDPFDSANYVVRRLAALEGYEMVSTDEEDEPFVIEHGQCWVLSDNRHLKPQEFNDSRLYGPISMTSIVGRVIYKYRSLEDHGIMVNNKLSMTRDMPVLYVELSSVGIITADIYDETKDS